tara:strand:- start:28285 stop:28785 length:501 start_codon:yes stop_codon:yes gene_type:complete
MKTSLIIISALLILSVFLPVFLFIYNGRKNTANIKKQINALIKNNGITYASKEIWRKNFIGISNDHKTLTYIHFKFDKPFIGTVSLADVKKCHVIKNLEGAKNKATHLKSLGLEFVYKSSAKPNETINFFNIDDDLTEDLELQRIEKWHALVKNSIPEQQVVKMAS